VRSNFPAGRLEARDGAYCFSCILCFRAGKEDMSHNIAGIDVHKKLLVVVVIDMAKPEVVLHSRRFGAGAAELSHLSAWLNQFGVVEAAYGPKTRNADF
jgi:hypothetical protein